MMLVPAQIAPDGLALMLTAGLTEELIVMVMPLLVAVAGLAQALLVITQVTVFPLASVVVV
jgi:hypothetical protein